VLAGSGGHFDVRDVVDVFATDHHGVDVGEEVVGVPHKRETCALGEVFGALGVIVPNSYDFGIRVATESVDVAPNVEVGNAKNSDTKRHGMGSTPQNRVMVSPDVADTIVSEIERSPLTGRDLRQFAMARLDLLPAYHWSGIYRLDGDQLHLDAYVGAATDHTTIPVGRGVCGTAVAENANQIVADVRELTNYLACSLQTRSEIVVLIRDAEGAILGQIDIDGHEVRAFDASDEALLERIARLLAQRW